MRPERETDGADQHREPECGKANQERAGGGRGLAEAEEPLAPQNGAALKAADAARRGDHCANDRADVENKDSKIRDGFYLGVFSLTLYSKQKEYSSSHMEASKKTLELVAGIKDLKESVAKIYAFLYSIVK